MNPPEKRVHALLCLLLALCLAAPLPIGAQPMGKLLIVSQPDPTADKRDQFINFAPYLERSLRETGRFEPLVFLPTLPALRAAVDAQKLAAADLTPPLSRAAIRKIAQVLSVNHTLRVSGRATPEGIAVEAEMESLTGQETWNTLFLTRLEPYRSANKRPRPTEAIYAHVESLVERITAGRVGSRPMKPEANPPPPKTEKSSVPVDAKPPSEERPKAAPPAEPPKVEKRPEVNRQDAPPLPAETVDSMPPQPAPNTPSAHEILVDRFRRQGDLTNLIVSLRRAVNDRPRDARLRRDLVRAYSERGWAEAARDEARRAVALAPEDATLRRLLGDAHLALNDTETALKEYQEAVRLDGKNGLNLVALGDAYWSNAQPEEAQRCYAEAAQVDAKSPLPLRRLARLYLQRGRFADCIAAVTQAKALTPADDMDAFQEDYAGLLVMAETSLGDILSKAQNLRKALREGTRTREATFKDVSAQKRRAEEWTTFLDGLPAPERFARVQALYSQAANLVVQALESALLALESGDTRLEEEATLQRLEAGKQIADAAKRLKALTTKREE